MNRRGALAGALGTAAAAAGAVAVVDRRIRGRRQVGRRALDRFVEPEADRTHLLRTADGVELYVDCKGSIEEPMARTFRTILREELEKAGVTGRVRAVTS